MLFWFMTNIGISTPAAYHGDGFHILTWTKAAAEGELTPFVGRDNPRLGFPGGSNWNDYPQYHRVIFWMLGFLANCTDLFTALHIGRFVCSLASVAGFYAACCLLNIDKRAGASLGMLFGLSWYHGACGIGHLFLCWDWWVPIGISLRTIRSGTTGRALV